MLPQSTKPPTKDNSSSDDQILKNENTMISTISNPKTIDKVIAKFVIKTLTTISAYPYYESLNDMIQALYANATTLPTTMSGVKHGHVSIITKDTMYAILETGTPWEDPDRPGAIPTITTNSTVARCQQANKMQ